MENEKLWNEMVDMVRESGADLFPREPSYLLACGLVIIAEAAARVAAATKDSEHDDAAAEFQRDALVLLLCLLVQDHAAGLYPVSGPVLIERLESRLEAVPPPRLACSIAYEKLYDEATIESELARLDLVRLAEGLVMNVMVRGKSLEAVLQATKDRLETEISLRRIDRLRESVQPLISRDKNNTAP
jgi:hypothetical protein